MSDVPEGDLQLEHADTALDGDRTILEAELYTYILFKLLISYVLN